MINNQEDKVFAENQIKRLENIIMDLKQRLLPERRKQFERMASVYSKEIIKIREEIEEYIGINELVIKRDDINIHIKGPIIDYGSAPISTVSAFLNNFRYAIQRLYVLDNKKSRKKKMLSDMTDFRLNSYQPGSINLSLGLPDKQIGMFDDLNVSPYIEKYFDILRWINNDFSCENYLKDIDDVLAEKLLLSVIKTLPDDKNISSIEFYGNLLESEDRIFVNHNSKTKVQDKIKKIQDDNNYISCNGVVRELDLDRKTFLLRNVENIEEISNHNQIKCILSDEQCEYIDELLGSKVSISGKLNNGIIEVITINNLD